jgi:AcrR family transcriptional regulator
MKKVKEQLTHRQRQALETQRLIVDAARALFLERGYSATTIDAISDKAGVSISTVYTIYKNKRGILSAIREDWHLQSAQREIYDRAVAEQEPETKLKLAAHATRRQWETSLEMITIYKGAATADPEAADELQAAQDGRRQALQQFIQTITPSLRSDLKVERATAIYLALTRAELYQELVDIAGWSPDEYETWLAETLKRQFLDNRP